MLDKSFLFALNTFFSFIYNKSLKDMLIRRSEQKTISEGVSDTVQPFIRRNFYL